MSGQGQPYRHRFIDDLHRIHHDEFDRIAWALGYDPAVVLSIHMTNRRVSVVSVNEKSELQSVEHKVVT